MPPTPPSPTKPPSEETVRSLLERAFKEISRAPKDEPQVLTRVTRELTEQFSGPLPHPNHLKAYEEISPGLADRIVRMAEKELDHNVTALKTQQSADNGYRRRGMDWALVAFLAMLALAAYCVFRQERVIAGIVFGGGLLTGIVSLFLRGVIKLPTREHEEEPPKKATKAPARKSKLNGRGGRK